MERKIENGKENDDFDGKKRLMCLVGTERKMILTGKLLFGWLK